MSGRIVTVTLNAAVDRMYIVPGFAVDHVHRPERQIISAGGKGVNVARAARTLGAKPVATGFVAGANGDLILRSLAAEGIEAAFETVSGESRICITVMDPVAGTQTEVNEAGPTVTDDDTRRLLTRLRGLARDAAVVVLSGRLPPGAPAEFYARIIDLMQGEWNVRVALDTSGEALIAALERKPWLVKPNAREAEVLGLTGATPAELAAAIRRKYGVEIAIVTMGASGAVAADCSGTWRAPSPPVALASALGSGDSFIAGFIVEYERRGDLCDALRWGVATGAANAAELGAGFLDAAMAARLAVETVVRPA